MNKLIKKNIKYINYNWKKKSLKFIKLKMTVKLNKINFYYNKIIFFNEKVKN